MNNTQDNGHAVTAPSASANDPQHIREMSPARAHIVRNKDLERGTMTLRPATAEDTAALTSTPAPADAKTSRWAEGFAAKWWVDAGAKEPTDAAMADVFKYTVRPPRPETYPLIRAAINANKPSVAAAPLYAALAAYETATHASFGNSLSHTSRHSAVCGACPRSGNAPSCRANLSVTPLHSHIEQARSTPLDPRAATSPLSLRLGQPHDCCTLQPAGLPLPRQGRQ